MQGSLDNPPIILRTLRMQTVKWMPLSAVFFAIGFYAHLSSRFVQQARGDLLMLVFGGFLLLSVWQIFKPRQMQISRDGVVWRDAFATRRFRWDDMENVRVGTFRNRAMAGFDFTQSYRASHDTADKKNAWGTDKSFGGAWEMKPEELVALLQQAQARWRAPQ